MESAKSKNKKSKKNVKSREWNHEEVVRLIDLWSGEECLFNVKLDDYHCKDKKDNAIGRIQDQLESEGISVTCEEIETKMHSLRVYYSSTRNKLEQSKRKSGSGAADVIKVKWAHFGSLSFLNDNLKSRQTITNLTTDDAGTSRNDSMQSSKKQRLSTGGGNCDMEKEEEREFRQSAIGYFNKISGAPSEKETEDDIFCNMLAAKLKDLPNNEQKEYLKLEIHGLVLKAKFGGCDSNRFGGRQLNNVQNVLMQSPPPTPVIQNYGQNMYRNSPTFGN